MIDTRTSIDFRERRDEFWGRVNATPDRDGQSSPDRGATGFSFGTVTLEFKRTAAQEATAEEVSPGVCETGRRVKLKKQRPGRDRVVGRDRVNKRDRWSVDVSENAEGAFYAVLPKKVVTTDEGTEVTCERARSRTAKPNR